MVAIIVPATMSGGAFEVFGATGGAAFTDPTSITGLMLWYDFSDLTKMFTDTAGTLSVASNNDVVGKILDKSGTSNHATAPTNGERPTYKTSLSRINCPQSAGMAFTNIKPAFVAVACTLTGTSGLYTLMGAAAGADTNSIRNNNSTTWRAPGNSADAGDFSYNDGVTKINNSAGFTFVNSTPHVLTVTPGTGGSQSTEGLETFGLQAALTRYWLGDIYQIVAYSSVPTSGQQASLVTYLGAKAGLTV